MAGVKDLLTELRGCTIDDAVIEKTAQRIASIIRKGSGRFSSRQRKQDGSILEVLTRATLLPQGDARISGRQTLSRGDLTLEFMMNALRLIDGFEESLFEARTAIPLADIAGPFEEAIERGLILREGGRIVPTARGIDYLNDLLQLFATD